MISLHTTILNVLIIRAKFIEQLNGQNSTNSAQQNKQTLHVFTFKGSGVFVSSSCLPLWINLLPKNRNHSYQWVGSPHHSHLRPHLQTYANCVIALAAGEFPFNSQRAASCLFSPISSQCTTIWAIATSIIKRHESNTCDCRWNAKDFLDSSIHIARNTV